MTDRLSALDVSFLYAEQPATPMHLGAVAVLEPAPGGFDHERLVASLAQRCADLPRYRQKVLEVPFRLARPVCTDDVGFDVTRHVRRVTLPAPGTDRELRDLVAQVFARPLDRRYPLWEMYIVDGLAGGRVALVHKVHHALADGVAAMGAAEVLFDRLPQDPLSSAAGEPRRRSEGTVGVGTWPVDAGPAAPARQRLLRTAGDLAVTLRTARRARPGPLNVASGRRRAFGTARTRLGDYQRLRDEYGVTVNDVALTAVTGALRAWLARRGELDGVTTLRALVPVSVRAAEHQPTSGNQISAYLLDLPVDDPDPVSRMRTIAGVRHSRLGRGQSAGVGLFVRLAGHAPAALYALAARKVNLMSRHLFNLAVSNVRGPRRSLHVAGARLVEVFPVVPLAHGQGLSIGLVSYADGVYYGLNADRDAVPDVDVLAGDLEQALHELVRGPR